MNKEKEGRLFQALAVCFVSIIIFVPFGMYLGANNSNYARTTYLTETQTVASTTITNSELCLDSPQFLDNGYVNMLDCKQFETKTVTAIPSENKTVKTVLIISIDGYIDSYLVSNFKEYFQNNPKLPDYLIIYISSQGGWSNDVALIGNALISFEKQGTTVVFVVWHQCTSGCFWLSSYANEVVFGSDSNQTTYGFGHDVKNSTIEMKGWGNFNGVSSLYVAVHAITGNTNYDYKLASTVIDAHSKLGNA